jgi:hypothetical protein
MRFTSIISAVVKGKVLAAAIVGVAVVGGATAAAAASPLGQTAIHTLTGTTIAATAQAQQDSHSNATPQATPHPKTTCPGIDEAQQLAQKFSLSATAKSSAVQTICELHTGTFQGENKVLGYGEIEDLFTYAQYLAKHDQANSGGKLTDANYLTYVHEALQKCGSTPLAKCVNTTVTPSQTGSTTNKSSSNANSTGNGTTNGNNPVNPVKGKPTATPTPRH